MNRPAVTADVVAKITESAPGRVRRKLDKNPMVADGWDWSADGMACVVTAENERVRFELDEDRLIADVESVECSCLLTPRCFHVLACLAVIEVAGEATGGSEEANADVIGQSSEATGAESSTQDQAAEFTDDQRAAAEMMWNEAADFLASGARSAGVLLQSRMLRAIHECRAVGLHRLANAGLRVVAGTRKVRADDKEFSPELLSGDLGELLRVAWLVRDQTRPADARLIGTARRRYAEVSNLKLQGLFCEPINTRAGHSGIVTYVIDGDGQIASIANVRPGDGNRVQSAWESSIEVGSLSLSHRELSVGGLLVQTGTMSEDRRLGTGQATRAARIDGDGWNAEVVQQRFAEPPRDQVRRVMSVLIEEPELWPAGFDLLFLRGTVVGTDGHACLLRLDDDQGTIRLVPDEDAEGVAHAENLETLSRGRGLRLDCVARLTPDVPSTAVALAVTAGPVVESVDGEPVAELVLADEWNGHVNVGLHRLRSANIKAIADEPDYLSQFRLLPPDGLGLLRSRVESLAVGGRHSLPTGRLKEIKREALVLKEQMQPTAGALLLSLTDAALESETSFQGVRFPADAGALAKRWLACSQYERVARLAFQRDCWLA